MCAGTFCNAIVSHRKIKQFPKHGHKGILTGGAKPELSQKQVRQRRPFGRAFSAWRSALLPASGRTQLGPESGCPVRVDLPLLISEISELPLRQSPISRSERALGFLASPLNTGIIDAVT